MGSFKRCIKGSAALLIVLFVVGLFVGGLATYYFANRQINNLNSQVGNLQSQVSDLQGFRNATYQNITILQNGTSLTSLYEGIRSSIVLVEGNINSGTQQGSGFVYTFSGRTVVLTNYHVVQGVTGLSVTFSDGNGYSATVLGNRPVL